MEWIRRKSRAIFQCKQHRQRKAILLTMLGEEVLNTLRNLCSPDKPSDKSLEQLFWVLRNYFQQKKITIAEIQIL